MTSQNNSRPNDCRCNENRQMTLNNCWQNYWNLKDFSLNDCLQKDNCLNDPSQTDCR